MTENNKLSDDEKILFEKAMSDVKPLTPKLRNHYKIRPLPKRPRTPDNDIHAPIFVENKYPNVESEAIIFFAGAGISKRKILDLKNAREKYQAVLDLHGHSLKGASKALSSFINLQYSRGLKIVLIIHGKSGKTHSPPVIKNLTNNYLRQVPEVLAFHSAKPQDGGTGAVYVLLKNSKPHIL